MDIPDHAHLEDFVLQIGGRTSEGFRLRVSESPLGETQGHWRPLEDEPFSGFWESPPGKLLMDALRGTSRRGLRLCLHFQGDGSEELAESLALPWELLTPPGGTPLALSPRTPVLRRLRVEQGTPACHALDETFQIVLALAAPEDEIPLDLEGERNVIEECWAGRSRVRLRVCRAGTLDELRKALLAGPCHILHFAGHGAVDAVRGGPGVLLERECGSSQWVTGEDFAIKLEGIPGLQLVVLNSCDSAVPPEGQPFAGLAHYLIRIGIPAVIAMRSPVDDHAALGFTRKLHTRLARGDLLEVALAEARQALHSAFPSEPTWSVPAIFVGPGYRGFRIPRAADEPERGPLLNRYAEELEAANRTVEGPRLCDSRRVSLELDRLFLAGEGAVASPPKTSPILDLPSPLRRDEGTPSAESGIRLEEVLDSDPYCALVGGVGIGKTSILRWIARRMGEAWLAGEDRLAVPTRSLCPGAPEGTTDLGPVRLPVLLHLEDFARERMRDRSITLGAWLGPHLGAACLERLQGPGYEGKGCLEAAFRDLSRAGRLLLLLDGLDEIGDEAGRCAVVREVDRWLQTLRSLETGRRTTGTGCTVLIALRLPLAGRAGPFTMPIRQFTLSPLDEPSLTAFVEKLERAIGASAGAVLARVQRYRRSQLEAPLSFGLLVLLAATLDSRSPALRPCLLRGQLVNLRIREWCRRRAAAILPGAEDADVLRLLAGWVVQRRDGPGEAKGWVSSWQPDAETLPARIARDLGLVDSSLRFFEVAMEDHLCARWLLEDPACRRDRVLTVLGKGAWREPVVEAFGLLSVAGQDLEDLVTEIEAADRSLAGGVPRWALALVAALPAMQSVPAPLIQRAARSIIEARAARGPLSAAPHVDQLLDSALAEIAEHGEPEVLRGLTRALCQVLKEPHPSASAVAAGLLRRFDLWNADLVESLVQALPSDMAAWGWPAHAALRRVAEDQPLLLPTAVGGLRAVLHRNQVDFEELWGDLDRLVVLLALYGDVDEQGRFLPESLYRESPLTPHLLPWLQCREGRDDFDERLVTLRSGAAESQALAVDAEVGLVALGRLSPAEVSSATAERLVPQAERLGPLLVPGILAAARNPEAPEEVLPALLAPVWRDLTSDDTPEGLYRAYVRLDTEGASLGGDPQRLAAILATAQDPLHADRGDETLALALDSVSRLTDAQEIIRGWILRQLSPLAVQEGYRLEVLILVLGALSDRTALRGEVLRELLDLDPQLCQGASRHHQHPCGGWLREKDLGAALSARVRQLSSEEHRRRCRAAIRTWFGDSNLSIHVVPSPLKEAGRPGPRRLPVEVETSLGELLPARAAAPVVLASRLLPFLRRADGGKEGAAADHVPVDDGAAPWKPISAQLESLVSADKDQRHPALAGLLVRESGRSSTNRLGRGRVEALARAWLAERDPSPPRATIIERLFERIRHDHPAAFEGWVEAASAEDGENADVAAVVLARIDSMTEAVWGCFRDSLGLGVPRARTSLLRSLCWMMARGHYRDEWWAPTLEVLRQPDFGPPEGERFLLSGRSAVVEIVEVLRSAADGPLPELLRRAECQLLARQIGWRELLSLPDERLKNALEQIGRQYQVSPRSELEVARAADRLHRLGGCVDLLAAWTEKRLAACGRVVTPDYWTTSDLLRLTAELSAREGSAWRDAVRRLPYIEKLLGEAALGFPTAEGRRSALLLLGESGKITGRVARALRSGLMDVPEVREAVFEASHRFSEGEPDVIVRLGEELADPNAEVAFTAAQLLRCLALSSSLPERERKDLEAVLEAAASRVAAQRPVALLGRRAGSFGRRPLSWVRRGRLHDVFAAILAEVRGDLVFAPRPRGEPREDV